MATERALLGYGMFLGGLAVSYLKGFGAKPPAGTRDEEESRRLRAREFRRRLFWLLGCLAAVTAGLILMRP